MSMIETIARQLCQQRGFDPDGLCPATLGKSNGTLISGFMPNWRFWKYQAEKTYSAAMAPWFAP